MILEVFVVLLGLGFATWLIGHVFQYTEIAALGAVIIIAAGAMVTVGGLHYQNGEAVDKDYMEFELSDGNTTVVNNETMMDHQYAEVSFPARVNLGALVMFIGAFLFGRRLEETSFGGG